MRIQRWLALPRLLTGLGGGVLLLVVVALLQPYPALQEADTLCVPLLGPYTTIPSGLSDTVRSRLEAHEAVHAAQCRVMGSWKMYAAHWSVAGRLRLEAEAECAEARLTWSRTHRPAFAFEALVDDLTYGVPRGASPGPEAARRAAATACPELAAAARTGGAT